MKQEESRQNWKQIGHGRMNMYEQQGSRVSLEGKDCDAGFDGKGDSGKGEGSRNRGRNHYLQTIKLLLLKNDCVKNKDVAGVIGVTPGTVTSMFKRLSSEGLIEYRSHKGVKLTALGERYACFMANDTTVMADFLKFLGVDEHIARADARVITKNVHTQTQEKLIRFMSAMQESATWKTFSQGRSGTDGAIIEGAGTLEGSGNTDTGTGSIKSRAGNAMESRGA